MYFKLNAIMDNLNIYNAEGYNMLSPGIQPLTTESVFKIRFFTVQLYNCIFYTRKYFEKSYFPSYHVQKLWNGKSENRQKWKGSSSLHR
jgi:hypothetical protein